MPHITINGWCYRDGYVGAAAQMENQHRFRYLRQAMAAGMSEADATRQYDTLYPAPRPGQANCPDCGQWTCAAPHE